MKTLPELLAERESPSQPTADDLGLTGFNPKYEGQSLADFMAGRDNPTAATVQGTDYQGRLRRFDSAEEMAANISRGRAGYEQASADRSNSIQFRRDDPSFAVSEFNTPQASQNIPNDVMLAAMTGNDPKRLTSWASSTQGQAQGGVAGLQDLLDPKAQARKERDQMQTAMSRRKLEGIAQGYGADKNDLANMSLLDLEGYVSQTEAQRVTDRYTTQQQEAQQQANQADAFSSFMADIAGGSTALNTGADMPPIAEAQSQAPGAFTPAAGTAGGSVLNDPMLQKLAQLHQAGVPVGANDIVKAIQNGSRNKVNEPEFITSPTGNNFVRLGNQIQPDRAEDTRRVPTSIREAETLEKWKKNGDWGKVAAFHKTMKEYNGIGDVIGERPMTAADAKALYGAGDNVSEEPAKEAEYSPFQENNIKNFMDRNKLSREKAIKVLQENNIL